MPVGALGGVLANLAEYDALTGLPNRTQFVRLARHAVDHGSGVPAMVDLDQFKQVYDTLGHAIGDRLLVELAQRLARHVRDGDTVARLGGDEFGIVLPDVTTEAETLHALGRIRSLLAEPLVIDDLPLAVEAGVGFVLIGWDGAGLDTLLTKVDVAMYAAKRGHLGVTRHLAEHEQYDATRLRLVGEPAGAIADEQLVLHHQPKTDLRTGQVTAVEALVRWQHPERGLLHPGDFLLAAEQTELADPLTRWVLQRATAALPRLDPTGKLSMAVNVSVRSLGRSDFADEVPRVPAGTRTAPNRILLEITETALLADPTKAASTRSAGRRRHSRVDRRFRRRPELAGLSRPTSHARAQGRQGLRHGDGPRAAQRCHRRLGHRPWSQPQIFGHGRGRGDLRGAGRAHSGVLRHGTGPLPRPPHRRGHFPRAAAPVDRGLTGSTYRRIASSGWLT